MSIKIKLKSRNVLLEIARNPVPPDKGLAVAPTPAIDSQIATGIRDRIDFPTSIFGVDTTQETPKTLEIHNQK